MSAPQRKPLKHLPKSSARKTEQERDAIARGEDERERKRQSEAARDFESERRRAGTYASTSARGGVAGRGGRGGESSSSGGERHRTTLRYARGGRGGFMGESIARNSRTAQDSQNPTSATTTTTTAPKITAAPTSTSAAVSNTAASNSSGAAATPRASRLTRGVKKDKDGDTDMKGSSLKKEPDESQEMSDIQVTSRRRINVEEINLITPEGSDDEGAMEVDGAERKSKAASASARHSGFMPVRIRRRDHVDRTVGINTEASSTAAAEIRKKWQDGSTEKEAQDMVKSTLARKGSSTTRQENNIVDESRQWVEEAVSDREEEHPETRVRIKQETRSSFNQRRKSTADTVDGQTAFSTSPTLRRQSKSRASEPKRLKRHGPPAGWDTHDWETEQKDRSVLKFELGHSVNRSNDEDGDTTITNRTDPRLNNIYLFQFPPSMPELHNAAQAVKREEPQSPTLNRVKAVTKTEGQGLDTDVDTIKIDEDEDGDFTVETAVPTDGRKSGVNDEKEHPRQPKLPSGRAGKLRVHESGLITISWGGVTFEVKRGMDRSFLQTAILTTDEKHKDGDVQYDGNATSLGQVRGKFIVVPETDNLTN